MTPPWPSNREYLYPPGTGTRLLPLRELRCALPNWQWVVPTLHLNPLLLFRLLAEFFHSQTFLLPLLVLLTL